MPSQGEGTPSAARPVGAGAQALAALRPAEERRKHDQHIRFVGRHRRGRRTNPFPTAQEEVAFGIGRPDGSAVFGIEPRGPQPATGRMQRRILRR